MYRPIFFVSKLGLCGTEHVNMEFWDDFQLFGQFTIEIGYFSHYHYYLPINYATFSPPEWGCTCTPRYAYPQVAMHRN